MKKIIGLITGILMIASVRGQELVMTPLGPKATDGREVIRESKSFIVYKGDTLNRRNGVGLKTGEWIEYRKVYLQRTSGATTVTDSTNASYVIESRGNYIKGEKNGLWNFFYRDGRIKGSRKYD